MYNITVVDDIYFGQWQVRIVAQIVTMVLVAIGAYLKLISLGLWQVPSLSQLDT